MSVSIIAELCQNHLGDFDILTKMIDEAVKAGATHIKIQHAYVENLTFRSQFETGFINDNKQTKSIRRPFQDEYERLKKLELSNKECQDFVAYVRSKGAIPVTTCFARGNIPAIKEQGFEAVKVASYDCASYQMLRELSSEFEQIFISTGATFINEIEKAAAILNHKKNCCFLHCVTIYPTPLNELNLSRMALLNLFSECVGFSDHTLVSRDGIIASKAALALGADVVERHFTVLGSDESRDGPVSITPELLSELVSFSKMPIKDRQKTMDKEFKGWQELMSGTADRPLSDEELLNRDYYRGRFATPRYSGQHEASKMVFNWEETEI
jgi:N,N'-diacetyllegionaminate synthase